MVDMFYDHFLARHWPQYHRDSLADFIDEVYRLLARRAGLLPTRLAELAPYMASQDWLGSYARVDSLAFAIDRMATRRLRQPNSLAGAADELLAHYEGFEADFHDFLPDAHVYARGFSWAWPTAG